MVDGENGPQTIRAVTLFQKTNGLPATGILDSVTISALSAKVPALPICAPTDVSFSAIVFYRDNRAQDASALKGALSAAGLNTEEVASNLTEVHLDQEYAGTTYVIPSNRLGDKGAALEDCVINVVQNVLPADLATIPPLRRGGSGTLHKGDIVIYLY